MKSNNSCMFVANIVVNPYICKPLYTPILATSVNNYVKPVL